MRGKVTSSVIREAEEVVRGCCTPSAIGQGDGVTIPTPLFFFGLGGLVGIILGPALIASTKVGAERLRTMAEEKLRG